MEQHIFSGKWITDREFADLEPRNVFHRQLEPLELPCDEHRDCHILFRKQCELNELPEKAVLYITADDYYKLYLNGKFVTQGPAPAYASHYGYNTVDVTEYLKPGKNVLAVHTLYQGLINRVWVSGDNQHGLICDLVADGRTMVRSDESFRTARHSAYREIGTVGYQTQFLEHYDAGAAEVGFEQPEFDDSQWQKASLRQHQDYRLVPQQTKSLEFETILPVVIRQRGNTVFVDFGACYVGYLEAEAIGEPGAVITVRCGQELCEDGSVRHAMRCNCDYVETWSLSGNRDKLDWFDYKSFRYAELVLPEGCRVTKISLTARHYPFALKAKMNPSFEQNDDLKRIWELCVHSQKYGVQEVIQDCMDREKGFYVGDGCYTALTHMVLTGDDSIVRKLIDDAFASTFITPGMVTCLDCAFMQEIAEYPLMLISLILWHYRYTGDRAYLTKNYPGVCSLLDAYRNEYEKDGLLQEMNKWCVVEWPSNFRDGYDVDITEGKICHEPHVALNAYYLEAIHCTNLMAKELRLPAYREEEPLRAGFRKAFYDEQRHLFRDSDRSAHCSYIGNVLPYAFCLSPDEGFEREMEMWIGERGITGVSFFGAFPLQCGFVRRGRFDLLEKSLTDSGAWLRMLREGATATYEGWGRDTKWNTSLFHLTLSDAALFLSDTDLTKLFSQS